MPSPEVELAEVFAEIARTLLAEEDEAATFERVCTLAVETIDGCEHAGMAVVKGKSVIPLAVSDPIAFRLDEIETEVGQGPCIDAIREHEVFGSPRLSTEERWPEFSRRAHEETGVESVLGFRLYADEETMGALDLYSTKVDAFSEEAQAIASVFAAHAAVAMASARQIEQLEEKAQSRDVIGQAKGILMATRRITEEEAFESLRRASQHLNVKLREVAETVARTGTLPDEESSG